MQSVAIHLCYSQSFYKGEIILMNYILKPIQVDSGIKLAIIRLRYHVICFYGSKFTLTTATVFKVWSVDFRSYKF